VFHRPPPAYIVDADEDDDEELDEKACEDVQERRELQKRWNITSR
jgi:hypothetical protein